MAYIECQNTDDGTPHEVDVIASVGQHETNAPKAHVLIARL